MVDRLIVSLSSESKNNDYYQQLIASNIPIVFFNRVVEEFKTSKVLFDDFKWAFFVTEHLIIQGYKDIMHLAGIKNLTLTKNRIKGFEAAHKKYKQPVGAIHVFKKHGFSESRLAEHTSPPITSVEQPTDDIRQIAAKLLLEQIENNGLFVPQTIVLNGRLNIRGSSIHMI